MGGTACTLGNGVGLHIVDWPDPSSAGARSGEENSEKAFHGGSAVSGAKQACGGVLFRFLLGGGSTNHCLADRSLIFNSTGEARKLQGICGSTTVNVVHVKPLKIHGTEITLTLLGALSGDDLSQNLLSESRLMDSGWRHNPDKSFLYLEKDPATRIPVKRVGGLFYVDLVLEPDGANAVETHSAEAEARAECLANAMGEVGLSSMLQEIAAKTMDITERRRLGHIPILPVGQCGACDLTKRQATGIRTTPADNRDQERQDKIASTDLSGPHSESDGGHRYSMPFVNLGSRDIVPFFCKRKTATETASNLRPCLKLREKPQTMLTDNGGEFRGEFERVLEDRQILVRRSPAYTPQKNGASEVADRVLAHSSACVLYDSGAPLKHWPSAIKYVAFTLNRLPRRVLGGKSSHELRTGQKPENGFLVAFWQRGFYQLKNPNKKPRSKFLPRRRECRLLCCNWDRPSYVVFDTENEEIAGDVQRLAWSGARTARAIVHRPKIRARDMAPTS